MADLLVQVYSDAAGDNHPQSAATISTNREAIGSTQTITATDAVARAQATRERNTRQETTGRADLLAPIAPVPREIIVPVEPSRREELEGWLTNLRGGSGDHPCGLARRQEAAYGPRQRERQPSTATQQDEPHLRRGRTHPGHERCGQGIGTRGSPLRIECYDISNTVGGAFQVASMVVFEDAIAKKSEYRRFAIRGKDGKGAVDDRPRFTRRSPAASSTATSPATPAKASTRNSVWPRPPAR